MSLQEHLKSGSTTLCRAWLLRRRDGVTFGFTDHDRDLAFDGQIYAAQTGFTASAMQQSTGMAVDNMEAAGALTDLAITEVDIAAGRFDDAEVTIFLVNWADIAQRKLLFRGSFGEITRSGGAFRAELRSFADVLNHPVGHVLQPDCSAVLGDARCKVDLGGPEFSIWGEVAEVISARVFVVSRAAGFSEGWFTNGFVEMGAGDAAGLQAAIRADQIDGNLRRIELWRSLAIVPQNGAGIRLVSGCDRRAGTCKKKFGNFLNFRGFPNIPGDDWLRALPKVSGAGA